MAICVYLLSHTLREAVCLWGVQNFLGWSKTGDQFFFSVDQRGDQNFLGSKSGGLFFFSVRVRKTFFHQGMEGVEFFPKVRNPQGTTQVIRQLYMSYWHELYMSYTWVICQLFVTCCICSMCELNHPNFFAYILCLVLVLRLSPCFNSICTRVEHESCPLGNNWWLVITSRRSAPPSVMERSI